MKNMMSLIAIGEAVVIAGLGITLYKTHLKMTHERTMINPSAPNNLSLAWPVEGTVTQKPNWQNMSIEMISTTPDAPIKAAEKGTVTRADCTDTTNGCEIIIDHGNHFFTLYGNNKENKVKVGDVVEKGQVIATIGIKLLFSFYRSDTAYLNPLQYLPKN